KSDALGHYVANDSQVQRIPSSVQIFGPVYWEGPAGPAFFTWPWWGQKLIGFKMASGRAMTPPAYSNPVVNNSGGSLSISSNGANGGIVWEYHGGADLGDGMGSRPGTLRALDASDVSKVLWSSYTNKTR